jgi:hypothetical protein
MSSTIEDAAPPTGEVSPNLADLVCDLLKDVSSTPAGIQAALASFITAFTFNLETREPIQAQIDETDKVLGIFVEALNPVLMTLVQEKVSLGALMTASASIALQMITAATYLHERGNYTKDAEAVDPGTTAG